MVYAMFIYATIQRKIDLVIIVDPDDDGYLPTEDLDNGPSHEPKKKTVKRHHMKLLPQSARKPKAAGARHRYMNGRDPWVDITPGYLLCYFGILMLNGFLAPHDVLFFWSDESGMSNSAAQNAMIRHCFLQIRQYLHFVDNHKMHPQGSHRHHPLQKIQPVLDCIQVGLRQAWKSMEQ